VQVQLLVPDAAPAQGLVPDAAPGGVAAPNAVMAPVGDHDEGAFARLVDAAGSLLSGAERAEGAFVQRRGGLQEMVVARARADVALAIATSAAQRATQAISTVLGMQV
jgi:hypothetical protein